jgi:hypothetical protein
MISFTAINQVLHTSTSPVIANRLRTRLRRSWCFTKCLSYSIDNLSLRSWRVFGVDKVEDECIELWHVSGINKKNPLIDFLKIAQVIVTEPPLDTSRQSLDTRGDRSRVPLKIKHIKSCSI